jgi:phosphoglycolate phosphatase-like HAD superfamily hydrolase
MKILVSDFDGVICNGLAEYFYSSHLVYQQLWTSSVTSKEIESQFKSLRPVIETGWEMPLLLRALVIGKDSQEIFTNWQSLKAEMLENLATEGITVTQVKQLLDQVRQQQIAENLEDWLNLHSFYEGVIDKLKDLREQGLKIYIITTKEGSFTRILLERQGIFLPDDAILGKEVQRPKYATLKLIIEQENIAPAEVAFLEDRLEALELVSQQPNLQPVNLFLAQWGYNTQSTQMKAEKNPRINLLSLAEFCLLSAYS